MNTSRIAAVALAVLMILPVALVAVPAGAAVFDTGVVVITDVASPNSPIVFVVNLTYLRDTLGWVGSQISFYLSNNGFASIDPATDYPIPGLEAVYAADVDAIAGTILLPDRATLQELVSNYDPVTDTGYVYLKIYDGNNVAVSERILIVLNTDLYLFAPNKDLAYAYGPLGTNNTFCFRANLTDINALLAAEGKEIDFSRTDTSYMINVTFISAVISDFRLIAFQSEVSNNTLIGPTSDIFNLDPAGTFAKTEAGITIARFNGTIIDYGMPNASYTETTGLAGITVDYYPFIVTFTIAENVNGSYYFNLSTAANVRMVYNNMIGARIPGDAVNLPWHVLSLGYNYEVRIYPSVEYVTFYDDPNTITGELNPNDQVELILHHYPANGVAIYADIYRYTGTEYSLLTTVNLTGVYTTNANGTATILVTLPEAPYGGLPYTIAVKVDGVNGIPMVNMTANAVLNAAVKPYIATYFATDDGTFRTPAGGPTAPGDYVLVKGHGFLDEAINVTAVTVTDMIYLFDLIELVSFAAQGEINVFSNGTFIAIVKIPEDAAYDNPFWIIASGETASNVGKPVADAWFDLGNNIDGVQKVYVNPVPVVVNATYGFISLGLDPAYPYPATWEDEAYRVFTIEAIGLDPVDFGKVSINITDGTYNVNLFVNETPTNGYLYIEDIPVPVIPYGDYDIVVYNSTSPGIQETTAFPQVNITPTAAVLDPLLNEYDNYIQLMAIIDVNVTGYGWPAMVAMEWDIAEYQMLGFVNFSIVDANGTQVYTNSSGAFSGILKLTLYISTPGLYHIIIHPADSSLSDTVTIDIGTAPALTVKVDTAKTKFSGDMVDVWILITFGGSELATAEQITGVKVSVYVYMDNGLQEIISEAAAEMVADGLWHFSFYLDPAYQGKDISVVVKACGRYLPYLPKQVAYDMAVLTVSGAAADILDQISSDVAQISTTVSQIQTQVGDLADTLSQVKSTVDTIDTKVNDLQTGINTIQGTLGDISGQLTDIQGSINDLSGKLDQVTQNVQTTLDQFKADLAGNLEQIGGGVSTYGLANLAITLLGFALLAFLIRGRQG